MPEEQELTQEEIEQKMRQLEEQLQMLNEDRKGKEREEEETKKEIEKLEEEKSNNIPYYLQKLIKSGDSIKKSKIDKLKKAIHKAIGAGEFKDEQNISLLEATRFNEPGVFKAIFDDLMNSEAYHKKLLDLLQTTQATKPDSSNQSYQTTALHQLLGYAKKFDQSKQSESFAAAAAFRNKTTNTQTVEAIFQSLVTLKTESEQEIESLKAILLRSGGSEQRSVFHEAQIKNILNLDWVKTLEKNLGVEFVAQAALQPDVKGKTPLSSAVNNGKPELLEYYIDTLLNENLDNNKVKIYQAIRPAVDSDKRNVLQKVLASRKVSQNVKQKMVDLVTQLDPKQQVDILKNQDKTGRNAFFLAIDQGYNQLAKQIVDSHQQNMEPLLLRNLTTNKDDNKQRLAQAIQFLRDDHAQDLVETEGVTVEELAKRATKKGSSQSNNETMSLGNALHIAVDNKKWQTAQAIVEKAQKENQLDILMDTDYKDFNPLFKAFDRVDQSEVNDRAFQSFVEAYTDTKQLKPILNNAPETSKYQQIPLLAKAMFKGQDISKILDKVRNLKGFLQGNHQQIWPKPANQASDNQSESNEMNLLDLNYSLIRQNETVSKNTNQNVDEASDINESLNNSANSLVINKVDFRSQNNDSAKAWYDSFEKSQKKYNYNGFDNYSDNLFEALGNQISSEVIDDEDQANDVFDVYTVNEDAFVLRYQIDKNRDLYRVHDSESAEEDEDGDLTYIYYGTAEVNNDNTGVEGVTYSVYAYAPTLNDLNQVDSGKYKKDQFMYLDSVSPGYKEAYDLQTLGGDPQLDIIKRNDLQDRFSRAKANANTQNQSKVSKEEANHLMATSTRAFNKKNGVRGRGRGSSSFRQKRSTQTNSEYPKASSQNAVSSSRDAFVNQPEFGSRGAAATRQSNEANNTNNDKSNPDEPNNKPGQEGGGPGRSNPS